MTNQCSNNSEEPDTSNPMETEEHMESRKEQTAVASLTSLVGTTRDAGQSFAPSEADEEETEHDDEEEASTGGNAFFIPQRFTKSGRHRAVPFPLKLMKVLSTKEFSHIIGWLPSGNSFVIHKPKVFTTQILPGHFKGAKYSSFTRKLHRWGFMRHYRGEEAGAFFHEGFQRGRSDLAEKMTCYKHQETAKPAAVARKLQPVKAAPVKVSNGSSTNRDETPRSMPTPPSSQMMHPLTQSPMSMQLTNALEGLRVYQRGPGAMETPMNGPQAARSSMDPRALNAFHRQSMEVRPDLNAAIEMEVSRRLKERMTAVAFNRMALMQQQQQHQQRQRQQQATATGFPRLQQQAPLLPPPHFSAPAPWNQAAAAAAGNNVRWNRNAHLAMAVHNLYGAHNNSNSNNNNSINGGGKPQRPQLSYAAFDRLARLPSTNIQGAKTA